MRDRMFDMIPELRTVSKGQLALKHKIEDWERKKDAFDRSIEGIKKYIQEMKKAGYAYRKTIVAHNTYSKKTQELINKALASEKQYNKELIKEAGLDDQMGV